MTEYGLSETVRKQVELRTQGMKYAKHIQEILLGAVADLPRTEWRDALILQYLDMGIHEQVEQDLKVGVANGYSIESQLVLVRATFSAGPPSKTSGFQTHSLH